MRRAWIAATVLLVTGGARADEETCQKAYVAGQRLYKLEHDFIGGREQLLVCASTCPDELRASCGRWLQDIAREVPSIVVRALDGRGHDVPNVSVDIDDHAIEHYVEGQPIELNAGPHTIVVHRASRVTSLPIVVDAGQKLRTVDVWTEPREATTVVFRRPVPIATWALLGVSAAALVSFGVFATWTTYEFGQTSACAPTCPGSNRDNSFDAKAAAADISLGVAAVAFVTAGVFYLTRPTIRVERPVSVSPWGGPGGAGLAVRGSF